MNKKLTQRSNISFFESLFFNATFDIPTFDDHHTLFPSWRFSFCSRHFVESFRFMQLLSLSFIFALSAPNFNCICLSKDLFHELPLVCYQQITINNRCPIPTVTNKHIAKFDISIK